MPADVAVIGAGPAGLKVAEIVSAAGYKVAIYDAKPSVGRKFLMAGKSGLNITHSENFDDFADRYGESKSFMKPLLQEHGSEHVQKWANDLGCETFVGSSGRVFPKVMKASPMLRAWIKRLEGNGVKIHLRHSWQGWDANDNLVFKTPAKQVIQRPSITVLALGGASWSRLGSDGTWAATLKSKGIGVNPFKPSNCGFLCDWSDMFKGKFAGVPVKSVRLRVGSVSSKGDFVISGNGIEGSAVYSVAAALRDRLENGHAYLDVDLLPDRSEENVLRALSKPRGKTSLSNHLRKNLGLKGVKAGLLYELLDKETMNDMSALAKQIKALKLPVLATRPIDEAISTAGGITLDELAASLELKKLPNVYAVGEMLDWDAPTGGYLLTACLAQGYRAGNAIAKKLGGPI